MLFMHIAVVQKVH